MPVIFTHKGFKFFFFSNEGVPREPLHVHVRKGEKLAKFWLKPEVALAESYSMTGKELRELGEIILNNLERIEKAWNEHFTK